MEHTEFVTLIGNLALLSALPALYLTTYRYGRGNWRATRVGRALFYLVLSLAVVCTLFMLTLIFKDYPLREYVRIAAYGFVSFNIWRLFFEMVAIQKKERESLIAKMKAKRHKENK